MIAALLSLIALLIAAQAPADFSGQWKAETASTGDMGSGWGPTIAIAQDAKQLVVESIVYSRYDLQPQPRFVYALDGSESRNTVMLGRGLQTQTSRAGWDGHSLRITTVHTFADPASGKPLTIEVTQKLTLESSTRLVVEASRSAALGGPPSATRTVYTKSS
jgi:hypothetical protein